MRRQRESQFIAGEVVALIAICLWATCATGQDATGQTALGADRFDRLTMGRTLFYGAGGAAYGVERYLPGRRVEWSFLDGRCKSGVWYPSGTNICFVYEDSVSEQCWQSEMTPDGLSARFVGDDDTLELYEARQSEERMYCMGPDVGA